MIKLIKARTPDETEEKKQSHKFIATATSAQQGENSDSDDDIVMPSGPPPSRRTNASTKFTPPSKPGIFETVSAPVKYTSASEPAFELEPELQLEPEPEHKLDASPKGNSEPFESIRSGFTVESQPEIRSFRKESTSFVPPSVLKRQRQTHRPCDAS